MSRSLIFAWFDFYFFESRNILPRSLGLGFLTRISASRGVSNFTIRHPSMVVTRNGGGGGGEGVQTDRDLHLLRKLIHLEPCDLKRLTTVVFPDLVKYHIGVLCRNIIISYYHLFSIPSLLK